MGLLFRGMFSWGATPLVLFIGGGRSIGRGVSRGRPQSTVPDGVAPPEKKQIKAGMPHVMNLFMNRFITWGIPAFICFFSGGATPSGTVDWGRPLDTPRPMDRPPPMKSTRGVAPQENIPRKSKPIMTQRDKQAYRRRPREGGVQPDRYSPLNMAPR